MKKNILLFLLCASQMVDAGECDTKTEPQSPSTKMEYNTALQQVPPSIKVFVSFLTKLIRKRAMCDDAYSFFAQYYNVPLLSEHDSVLDFKIAVLDALINDCQNRMESMKPSTFKLLFIEAYPVAVSLREDLEEEVFA